MPASPMRVSSRATSAARSRRSSSRSTATSVGEPAAWTRTLAGNLLLAEQKPVAAKRRFREALAFVPGYPGALSGLAEIRAGNGDLEGARTLYARAAAAAPVPEFAESLGDTLAQLGRLAAAERAWKRAEELERLFAANGGRNLLETAEFDLNHDRNFRSALDRARRGRAERPSVEGDHVLAWALYKNDKCAEARTVSLRSFRLGTLDVDGLYHHSLIEACLGNAKAAAAYSRRCGELDPAYLANAAVGAEARRRSRIDSAAWTRSASPTSSASPRRRLEPGAFGYYAGGAGDERALAGNVEAWRALHLRPRVLVDVSEVSTATTVLGTPVSMPLLVAPTAIQRLAHPDGEPGMARAAAAAGTIMCLSTLATATPAEVAAAAPGAPRWFQLYVFRDRGVTRSFVEQAVEHGYGAIVLTVDAPRLGRRERDLRTGFRVPEEIVVPSMAAVGGWERRDAARAARRDRPLAHLGRSRRAARARRRCRSS